MVILDKYDNQLNFGDKVIFLHNNYDMRPGYLVGLVNTKSNPYAIMYDVERDCEIKLYASIRYDIPNNYFLKAIKVESLVFDKQKLTIHGFIDRTK